MSAGYQAEYKAKLCAPADAVRFARSGSNISMGMALGEPPALLAALNEKIVAGNLTDIRLWYFHSMPAAAQTLLRYDMMDHVHPHCMFMGPTERALAERGETEGRKVLNFVPVAFSDAPRLLSQHVQLDTFIVTVSPMDKHGYFSFGTNNDYASTAARSARHTVVEVNEHMPRVLGDSMIHVSEIDAIIENHEPLFEAPAREASAEERQIGELIADLVPDGACLQMGIGALPNEVCGLLKDRTDLGIHTELLSPGMVDLIDCGAVTNRRKNTFPGRTVFTFALGNKRMYDLLDDNPSINSHPVNIVNDPRHIAKNDGVISINATLQVDLFGACNSENLAGRQYSGSGGQLDFVRGARASRGGKSIIACTSTAKHGAVSRIVPELTGPVTTPRNDVDTVVTEFGVAQLIGLSGEERARAMIALAHPDHRAELEASARKAQII
ncbi:acetyl-CoA hydrolase/transferase C-terminal domain-containing protein [Ponticaulis sp.]|uniref:acetyl-CoA hydrolase/transferase family protein n=1 Tax=Ponticaulis sp. TaxID=2020902 RepID=UPI000C57259A|nr:acetyl-CoA hydrolase/transferase C-terminal domain-containing protein [Ponticaulis sp.]MAJ10700.1 4-hydroxybutyrate--acetyl-CoA CoA transferase [Ponticaulis sp.]HBH89830.1 4-hydroxybutyrate--acetyl-CoA CoA transferase [Hyphomonadaceae bacterium]HBJ94808.1 4-hydroxybutyrate--acetyl-CoA CoA transferase [Hyphomonadaceae bacterium]|tara:strand:+ start:32770 stop:34092 length:1323 start_codon:yes stop_codon:yes gene_type:complete